MIKTRVPVIAFVNKENSVSVLEKVYYELFSKKK